MTERNERMNQTDELTKRIEQMKRLRIFNLNGTTTLVWFRNYKMYTKDSNSNEVQRCTGMDEYDLKRTLNYMGCKYEQI